MILGDITCSVGAWVGGILCLTRGELGQVARASLVLRGESDGMGCILEPHSRGFPVLLSGNQVCFCWRIWVISRKIACLTMLQVPKEYQNTSAAASVAPCLVGCYVKPFERQQISSFSHQVKYSLCWQQAWSCKLLSQLQSHLR